MATKKTSKKKVETEEIIEQKETAKVEKPKATKTVSEPFFVQEGQTQISSRRNVFALMPNAKRVVVENLGGGDLYVGTDNINFVPENLVRVGETKEIKGVRTFYVGALSRPFFRISHFE